MAFDLIPLVVKVQRRAAGPCQRQTHHTDWTLIGLHVINATRREGFESCPRRFGCDKRHLDVISTDTFVLVS